MSLSIFCISLAGRPKSFSTKLHSTSTGVDVDSVTNSWHGDTCICGRGQSACHLAPETWATWSHIGDILALAIRVTAMWWLKCSTKSSWQEYYSPKKDKLGGIIGLARIIVKKWHLSWEFLFLWKIQKGLYVIIIRDI